MVVYVDDFAIVIKGGSRRDLETDANNKLELFGTLCHDFGIELSPAKSVSMLFGPNYLPSRGPIFKIGGVKIPVKDNIDYLGVTLDRNWNWIEHMDRTRDKISPLSSRMRSLNSLGKGMKIDLLKIWYSTVIERQILYAVECWGKDLGTHSARKLDSAQRTWAS